MTSDLCNKHEQITTSYILSVLKLTYPKPQKEENVDVPVVICTLIHLGFLLVISNIVCIPKRLSVKAFSNHLMAGMIIAHYLERDSEIYKILL